MMTPPWVITADGVPCLGVGTSDFEGDTARGELPEVHAEGLPAAGHDVVPSRIARRAQFLHRHIPRAVLVELGQLGPDLDRERQGGSEWFGGLHRPRAEGC